MTLTQINKAGLDELALDHVFTIGASGTNHYTFQGEGLNGTVNDPTLYLTRGKTYRFENGTGAHAIRIQSADDGTSGTLYNTGVTNNNTTGTVIVEVQHDAPDVLYYQCASHANMKGTIYITGALADGNVTTAKLADDAVTTAKIAANAVTAAEIQSNTIQTGNIVGGAITTDRLAADAVTGAKIADNAVAAEHIAANAVGSSEIADTAVTLAKLEHGTGSNDGKFLRANNGADPTFETVTGTTITNNVDNYVITGTGTSNTLNGESKLTMNGNHLQFNTDANGHGIINKAVGNHYTKLQFDSNITSAGGTLSIIDFKWDGDTVADILAVAGSDTTNKDDGILKFRTSPSQGSISERMRITQAGILGINTTNPEDYGSSYNGLVVQAPSGNYSGITVRSNYAGAGALMFADGTGSDAERRNGFVSCDHVNKYLNFGLDGTRVGRFSTHGFHPNSSDSTASTALDDYEEGSFSPSWQMTQNSPSITYYDQQGQYTKIGRVVHFQIYLRVNAVNANGSGIMYVSGLPYNAVSNTGQGPAFGCLSFGYMDTVQGMNSERSPHGYVEANDSKIYMYWFPDGSGHAQNMTVANNITNNTKIMMSGSYQTS